MSRAGRSARRQPGRARSEPTLDRATAPRHPARYAPPLPARIIVAMSSHAVSRFIRSPFHHFLRPVILLIYKPAIATGHGSESL